MSVQACVSTNGVLHMQALYGKEDTGTFASAVYMARACWQRYLRDRESHSPKTWKAREKKTNRERAVWLLLAWSRYCATFPTGQVVRHPDTHEEVCLAPDIETCSLFPDERVLLRFALSRAVLRDGHYVLEDTETTI